MTTIFEVRVKNTYYKTYTNFMTIDQFLLDFLPKRSGKQTIFKLSYGNITNSITMKMKYFQQKQQKKWKSDRLFKSNSRKKYKKEFDVTLKKYLTRTHFLMYEGRLFTTKYIQNS